MRSCFKNPVYREKVVIEQGNLQQIFAIWETMSLDEKAKLVKQLLRDSNILHYVISFFDEEQIAGILRTIADEISPKAS